MTYEPIRKYSSSSEYNEASEKYGVNNLASQSLDDCWCEGVDGNGIGETIKIVAFESNSNVSSGIKWDGTYRNSESIDDVADYILSSDFADDIISNPRSGASNNDNAIITENNISNYYNAVYQIDIINGYTKTEKLWRKNNRVKKMKLTFDDKEEYILELEDTMDVQVFNIEYKNECVADEINMEFEIMEVYQGEECDDTCLTRLDVLGYSNVHMGGI